ncbi:MAG: hypothetical protein H7146_07380 [Burkholderiaceae bacterium]|nr:hypothetical protein [Microbacteriaceae bacterium]
MSTARHACAGGVRRAFLTRTSRDRASGPLAFILLILLGGCSMTAATPGTIPLPDGVTVSVYQSRSDLAMRRLEVTVDNGSDSPLTITGLIFDSSQFSRAVVWAKDSTTIAPGATADLPVLLADPVCGDDGLYSWLPRPTVRLDLSTGGTQGTAEVIPDDRNRRLPALMVEDCLAASIEKHASITAATLPRMADDGASAQLDLTVIPTRTAGRITIEAAGGTTLVALADPATMEIVPSTPIGLTVGPTSATSVVTLTIVPNRCDPHAVAEDKRGSIIPLHVSTEDGRTGVYSVVAGEAVRLALYDFVLAACAE